VNPPLGAHHILHVSRIRVPLKKVLEKFYFTVRQVVLGFHPPYLKEALEIESFGSQTRISTNRHVI
jgi:hypothetical protein